MLLSCIISSLLCRAKRSVLCGATRYRPLLPRAAADRTARARRTRAPMGANPGTPRGLSGFGRTRGSCRARATRLKRWVLVRAAGRHERIAGASGPPSWRWRPIVFGYAACPAHTSRIRTPHLGKSLARPSANGRDRADSMPPRQFPARDAHETGLCAASWSTSTVRHPINIRPWDRGRRDPQHSHRPTSKS